MPKKRGLGHFAEVKGGGGGGGLGKKEEGGVFEGSGSEHYISA